MSDRFPVETREGVHAGGLYCPRCHLTFTCEVYALAKDAYWNHVLEQHKGDMKMGVSIACASIEAIWPFGDDQLIATLLFTQEQIDHLRAQLE